MGINKKQLAYFRVAKNRPGREGGSGERKEVAKVLSTITEFNMTKMFVEHLMAVLNLLYMFSKRSNFISRLAPDRRQLLLTR